MGDVTNDGSAQTQDYALAINARSQHAQAGLFADGTTSPTAYAGFGDAYQPITPMSQGSSEQANANYTVQAGDTLASIAQAQWGDTSLWYLIADANGLSATPR